MNKNLSKASLGVILAVGSFIPLFPTEMKGSTWDNTRQVAMFNTADGLLADNQYAIQEDGTYLVKGFGGFGDVAVELTKDQTEQVEIIGSQYIETHVKVESDLTEKEILIVNKDDEKYERVSKHNEKPIAKEQVSLIEMLIEPEVARADYTFAGRSAGQISVSTQTITFAHRTIADDVLVVRTASNDAGSDTVQSMTYNSVSLTIETNYASSTKEVSLWYLVSPATGSNNLFVDLAAGTGSTDDALIVAHGYSGVDTSDVFDVTQSAYGTGTTTNTITGHVAGGYGIDTISTSDSSINVNENQNEGARISYYDAGSETFYTHDYFMKRTNAKTCDISGQSTLVTGIYFKTDGSKMYVLDSDNDAIYQYSLSPSWDVSSCSYDSVSLSVAAIDTSPQDLWIKDDGTRAMIAGDNDNLIDSLTCSTGWDISSCLADGISTSSNAYESSIRGFDVSSDGTKLVFTGTTRDNANRFDLGTGFDLSSSNFISSSSISSNPTDIDLISDGNWFATLLPVTGEPRMHWCTTSAYDMPNCVWYRYVSAKFDSLVGDASAAFYSKDQQNYYIASPGTNLVYQYEYLPAATTTVTSLTNPTGNEAWISLAGILKPAVTGGATSTIQSSRYWEEE